MKPNASQIGKKCEIVRPLRTTMAGSVVILGGRQIIRRRCSEIPISVVRERAGIGKGFQPSRFAE